jgi:putative ABC transport system permease protein
MALGATRSRVVVLVVKEGLVLACVGLGPGLIGAYFVGREMQSILFGMAAIDFPSLVGLGLVFLFAALLACYPPALRAATVEIMQALRND